MNTWNGILKIIEIQHIRDGKVLWHDENILNMLHTSGEEFLLSCCFANDGTIVPTNYHFGLDSRSTLALSDTMSTILTLEPSGNGYARQQVSSNGGFAVQMVNGYYRAVPQIVNFTATGTYGPVRNLFMSDMPDNSGTLISSAQLSSAITFASGDSVALRMSLQLKNQN